jgi:hypothetical protein
MTTSWVGSVFVVKHRGITFRDITTNEEVAQLVSIYGQVSVIQDSRVLRDITASSSTKVSQPGLYVSVNDRLWKRVEGASWSVPKEAATVKFGLIMTEGGTISHRVDVVSKAGHRQISIPVDDQGTVSCLYKHSKVYVKTPFVICGEVYLDFVSERRPISMHGIKEQKRLVLHSGGLVFTPPPGKVEKCCDCVLEIQWSDFTEETTPKRSEVRAALKDTWSLWAFHSLVVLKLRVSDMDLLADCPVREATLEFEEEPEDSEFLRWSTAKEYERGIGFVPLLGVRVLTLRNPPNRLMPMLNFNALTLVGLMLNVTRPLSGKRVVFSFQTPSGSVEMKWPFLRALFLKDAEPLFPPSFRSAFPSLLKVKLVMSSRCENLLHACLGIEDVYLDLVCSSRARTKVLKEDVTALATRGVKFDADTCTMFRLSPERDDGDSGDLRERFLACRGVLKVGVMDALAATRGRALTKAEIIAVVDSAVDAFFDAVSKPHRTNEFNDTTSLFTTMQRAAITNGIRKYILQAEEERKKRGIVEQPEGEEFSDPEKFPGVASAVSDEEEEEEEEEEDE